ncbi:M20/M25/M40 family metallo-hydrolase [Neobacillus sp. BF23-41]|uniref:M20/M25/M40 family metallo-hydrolase n=1 Tax=Neobacillus sp. BF23-41 TaxID=3240280 RepID=UPI0034E461E1
MDTVNSGGRFDGAMGVLMGVEVLCTLKEKGIQPARTIKVVSLTDEEGARFDYAFIGSTALVGTGGSKKLKKNLASATDKDGISYLDAMKQASLEGEYFNQINPDLLERAQLGENDVKAYIEVHIEQGKVLENKDLAVGIVTEISGGEWAEVTIMGEAGHDDLDEREKRCFNSCSRMYISHRENSAGQYRKCCDSRKIGSKTWK